MIRNEEGDAWPQDLIGAAEAVARLIGHRGEEATGGVREAVAHELLERARRGDLRSYAITVRRPTWVWDGVLRHRDPFDSRRQEHTHRVQSIAADWWYLNDDLAEVRRFSPRSEENAKARGAILMTHDNATRFVAQCMSWGTALVDGSCLAEPTDPVQRSRAINEAIKLGDLFNERLRWSEEVRLAFSLGDLITAPPAGRVASSKAAPRRKDQRKAPPMKGWRKKAYAVLVSRPDAKSEDVMRECGGTRKADPQDPQGEIRVHFVGSQPVLLATFQSEIARLKGTIPQA